MIDLRDYKKRIWSQKGEDGMIEKLFQVLEITNGHVVELGAWDGIHYSNVYNLINQGWSGTLIEGDEIKFNSLCENMGEFSDITTVQKMITLEVGNTLNEVLEYCKVPKDFDILSLDVDGCDYWIWKDLYFKPKVVVAEYNSNWENSVTVPYNKTHVWDGTQFFGASATALNSLAISKGYDLIGHCPYSNLFFVDSELNNGRFKILDLEEGFHVSKNHHKTMSSAQVDSLVFDPPV